MEYKTIMLFSETGNCARIIHYQAVKQQSTGKYSLSHHSQKLRGKFSLIDIIMYTNKRDITSDLKNTETKKQKQNQKKLGRQCLAISKLWSFIANSHDSHQLANVSNNPQYMYRPNRMLIMQGFC